MRYLYIVALAALLWQCNRPTYTASSFPDDYLELGGGGGYSGEVDSYFLLPNGQVFTSNSLAKDTLPFAQLNPKVAKELLARFTADGLDTLLINAPENIYRYISRHQANGEQRLVWGDPLAATPNQLNAYYEDCKKTIMAATQKNK